MADITRGAAVTLTNRMLKKYRKAIGVCQEFRDALTKEAGSIVSDYESNGIDEIIAILLADEGYFGNYDNDELYNLLDMCRKMLKSFGFNLEKDIKAVESVKDAGNLTIESDVYRDKGSKDIKTGEKIVYNIMNGEKRLDGLISRMRYAVEWQIEKLETPTRKLEGDNVKEKTSKNSIENLSILYNRFDKSFTFSEPGKYKVFANIYERDLWGFCELADIVSYEQVVEVDKLDGEISYNVSSKTEGEFFSFKSGIFYIDARGTGITISTLFKDIFPETRWETDEAFYREICSDCLGISDPNCISGEYEANLQFDGDKDTKADNNFGSIMRKKYLSERFEKDGYDALAEGRAILKQFDEIHGTKICKSEDNNYEIQDRVYHELIPDNNNIDELRELLGADILKILLMFSCKDIVSSILALNLLYGFINPYIEKLWKRITTLKRPELKKYAENWIKYIEKFHIESIDDFEMNQGEIMGFIEAVSVLVSSVPEETNIITYEVCFGLSHNFLENSAYGFYERGFKGGCANLKNNLIDLLVSKKEIPKEAARNVKEGLQNSVIASWVIQQIPEDKKSLLAETFSIENIAKAIDETAQKISESKTDLEQFEKTYIHKLMGFTYNPLNNNNGNGDYYYTEEGSLQSKMGFMDYYDDCGKYIGMDGLKDIVVTFPYEDKEYRVEFWYGPYGDGRSMGAEIGIYYRSLSDVMERGYKYKDKSSKYIFYDCVKDENDKIADIERKYKKEHDRLESNKEYDKMRKLEEEYNKIDFSKIKSDQFVMTMTVKYQGAELYTHETNGHTGKDGNADHFWCLAIRSSKLGKEEKFSNRKEMEITGTIEKTDDPKLISVMKKALESNNKIKVKSLGLTQIQIKFGGKYEDK